MSILRAEAFKVQYCTERIYVNKHTSLHMAIPMVSFADIRPTDYVRSFWQPKQKGERRMGYYGDYAIGLNKDWAVRNNIIPILYVPKPKDSGNVLTSNNPIKCLEHFAQKNLQKNQMGQIIEDLPPIASFCKHYIGFLENKVETDIQRVEYSFHLEQEWRYVSQEIPVLWNFYRCKQDPDYTVGEANKANANKNIKELLGFDLWKDVTYIVVKSNNACGKVLKLLEMKYKEQLRENKMSVEELEDKYAYLRSCVITTEQLINNL